MKTLIVMAIGVAVLTWAAKYYKISSLEDIKNLVPNLKNVVPNFTEMFSKS